MLNKLLFPVLLALAILSADCLAQDPDSLLKKAEFYYLNEEYQLAIPRFTEYLNQYPDDFRGWQTRGNCFRETGQTNLAIQDYKAALRLKNNDSRLVYSLADAYDKASLPDSSLLYYKRYISLEPNRTEGFTKLCLLYMYNYPEQNDSAIYFAGRAVKIEPESPMNYNFLALAYYSADQYKSALESAKRGLAIDSSLSILNRTAGIISFFLHDYVSAIKYFDSAFASNPEDYIVLDYKIQSMLLQNTYQEKLEFPAGGSISLVGIASENLHKSEAQVLNKKSNYYFNKLLQKFRTAPLGMSLDEFFMFYLGSSLQPEYLTSAQQTSESPEQHSEKEIQSLEEMLYVNPCDFPQYLALADLYMELGDYGKYFENRYKYYGFLESIKASGDGRSTEKAYVVTHKSHESNILWSLGYSVKKQTLAKHKKHHFDILSVTDEKGEEMLIYFNIDKPYEAMREKGKN